MQISSYHSLSFKSNFYNKNTVKSSSKKPFPHISSENKINSVNSFSLFLNEWLKKHNISAKTMSIYKNCTNQIKEYNQDTYNFLKKSKVQLAETSFVISHLDKESAPVIKQRVILTDKNYQLNGFFDVLLIF